MEITDAFKYPVEKLVYFVAGVIPGGVALIIFERADKGAFQWFFGLGSLGYMTKLWLILLTAFLIGHTITTLLSALVNDLGFVLAEQIGSWMAESAKSSFEFEVGPWRSTEWRNAVRQRRGAAAPSDIPLMTIQMMEAKSQIANLLPPDQKSAEQMRILQERTDSILNDMEWHGIYSHYHQQLMEPDDKDVVLHIRGGLEFNFVAAALYVLASALVVRDVRHWWCIAPSLAWVLATLLSIVAKVRRSWNKWSTLQDQITYLSQGQI